MPSSPRYSLIVAVAGGLLLTACASRPTPAPAPAPTPTPPAPTPAPPSTPATPAPTPEPTAVFSLRAFIGASPETVRNRFGAPALTRQEGTAEVWQYERRACVLHFYIYPTGRGDRAVTYAEFRAVTGAAGTPPVHETCVKAFGRTP